jgi:hypothetical protein
MFSRFRLGIAGSFVLAMSAAPALADVLYTDNTFNLSNYSASPAYSSDPSASISYSSASNTLQFTANFTSSNNLFTTAIGLANTTFTYNPQTQGAITSIDASVSKDLTAAFGSGTPGGPLGNTFRPLIEQDGTFYLAGIAGPSLSTIPATTGYNTIAQTGLEATDFLSYDFATGTFGSANPNFGGDPMLFGLAQISGINWYTPGQIITDYQHLVLDIHSAPEPSTVALFGAALLGCAWFYRREVS